VAHKLEYLDEALEEAEAAARWYAKRSLRAAAGFSDEIDVAEDAIAERPNAWPPFEHGTRRYLLRRYPFSIIYEWKPTAFSSSQSRTRVGALDTGTHGCRRRMNNACGFASYRSALLSPRRHGLHQQRQRVPQRLVARA
jgi:plasmid stabilization system protein ParE